MHSFKQHLAAALREREPVFVRAVASATNSAEGPQYSTTEIEQMVRGFYRMLDESLVGEQSELRAFYMESLLPGLRDAGTSLAAMVPGTARVLVMIASDAIAHVPADARGAATDWFGTFTERYTHDVIDLWGKKASG